MNCESLKVAIVQQSPEYLDKKGCLDLAVKIVERACDESCRLVVFGETWFTGYPAWLDYYHKIALWDYTPTKQLFRKMCENALKVPGAETATFCELSKQHEVTIVLGCNEIVNGTIYNTALVFTPNKGIANHHRKLMPTFTEKLIYGIGDGGGLQSVSTSFGRLTVSICWEHWMPLVRQALHNSGEDIHIALWPKVHEMHQVASRHYAFEGRCFVIAAGQMLNRDSMPEVLTGEKSVGPEWLLNGGSCIIRPDGSYQLEPQFDLDQVLYHEIENLSQVEEERMTLDVTGHYSRSDIFQLGVNRFRKDN